MKPDDLAVGLVALYGGELRGRTRLQKITYLLDQAGANTGLRFFYHNYGPYSAELAQGCDTAWIFDRLEMEKPQGEYSHTVFRTSDPAPALFGAFPAGRARTLIAEMKDESDVVLELAATIVFLRQAGFGGRVFDEVKIRKPQKATDVRLDRAAKLLARLGI